MSKRAFSLIEIAITLVISALLLGPLLHLLSTTNRESSASMFEIMGTYYAREIGEQLLTINESPGFSRICSIAGKDLPGILHELEKDLSDSTREEPLRLALGGSKMYLLVSPILSEYRERKLIVEPVTGPAPVIQPRMIHYKVIIRLTWDLPGESKSRPEPLHSHESIIFLNVET